MHKQQQQVEDLNIAKAHSELVLKALNKASTQREAAALLGITERGLALKREEFGIVQTKDGMYVKQESIN